MNKLDNPFHDLWLTEILSPTDFVRMFSPIIVEFSEALFGRGNVVVRGRQGSGKSMLLRLLDTKTRVAYAESGIDNPVPPNRSFICGSVNLTRSNFSAISVRLPQELERAGREEAATTFADFLNYSLALDLLQSVMALGEGQISNPGLRSILQIDASTAAQKRFCTALGKEGGWYGAFATCTLVEDILRTIQARLDHYRAYFNFNVDALQSQVRTTRTEIGEPISSLSNCLRSSGMIPEECLAYFKIDQHEELFELERETGLGDVFRQVVNKALAGRDRRCAYRIGTRHYSWSSQVKIWGTAAHLEDMRDYSVVDIDEMFRRPESSAIGDKAFRTFAQDVFQRRLSVAGFQPQSSRGTNLIRDVFGATPTARERARTLATPAARQRRTFPEGWSDAWRSLLIRLREEDPLDAKLGEAWLLQRSQLKRKVFADDSAALQRPWRQKTWWIKERSEVALMHLSSETGQNMTWYGERHIIGLSGWNILAFMSICRTIWSGWLRRQSNESLEQISCPTIDPSTQVVGIYEASKLWIDKLREGQDGEGRRRFILGIGEWFVSRLRADKALSNPGHNGFSLLESEFERADPINETIRRCRDYGDLIESPHTSKSKSGKRLKWYLNPILCPYFGLPHVRTKEPIYADLSLLRKALQGEPNPRGIDDRNLDLFERLE